MEKNIFNPIVPSRYGDTVRKLFLMGAIVMIITYPSFSSVVPETTTSMIGAIVLLSILAGLTDWRGYWTAILDVLVSISAVAVFEDHAVVFAKTSMGWIFLTDQFLVIIFIIAVYFSVRALREIVRAEN
jgi:hypothetical protein